MDDLRPFPSFLKSLFQSEAKVAFVSEIRVTVLRVDFNSEIQIRIVRIYFLPFDWEIGKRICKPIIVKSGLLFAANCACAY